jgi:hypothetical protein
MNQVFDNTNGSAGSSQIKKTRPNVDDIYPNIVLKKISRGLRNSMELLPHSYRFCDQ